MIIPFQPPADHRSGRGAPAGSPRNGHSGSTYIYDFGDDWEHEVKLRRVVTDDASFKRRLLAGSRACPPEDCGSVPGYYRMVEFLETGEDPAGDDAVDLAEWLGNWKPDELDLAAVKRRFDC